MSEQELEREILSQLPDERRTFVRSAVLDSAFTPPVVASFALDSLRMDSASALTPNASG
jgi:hypothetical protein